MKLHRRYAWLFVGPVSFVSGCAIGPLTGVSQRDKVVSLERPEPLVALQRSTQIESDDADRGVLRAAGWFRHSDDPEEQRQILLTGARRRASQQMTQQMMMTMPLLMQEVQAAGGPVHPGGGPSAPRQTGGNKAGTSAPMTAMPQMLMPQMNLTPEGMAEAMAPRRRSLRGRGREEDKESRADAKVDREANSASTEADRIERAAQAEAERAEKAALAEATIAERRLLAEAELAERMVGAELELAERLAAAKDERDRRLALAREERDLRMAILGIDTKDLDSDPVDDALAKLNDEGKSTSESGAGRLGGLFRSRSNETEASLASSSRTKSRSSATKDDASRATSSDDLVARSLQHSDELLDRPSIAEYASSRPAEFPSVVQKDGRDRSAPASQPAADAYDSLLSRESIASSDPAEPEDWSLLDSFGTSPSVTDEPTTSAAPEFPVFAGGSAGPDAGIPADAAVATAEPAAAPAEESTAQTGRKSPEDDLWILGSGGNPASSSDADRSFPGAATTEPSRDVDFTNPGGIFARSSQNDVPAEAASTPTATTVATTDAGSPPAFPDVATSGLENFGTASAGTGAEVASVDPWVNTPVPSVAANEANTQPSFDWSITNTGEPATATQTPVATTAATDNPTIVQHSLRSVCGPLPQDLEALVNQLDIPEAGVRKAVLEDFGRLGAKARPAAPAIRVLLDDSPLVAAHAAWTLWQVEANEAQTVQELVRLMQTGDPDTVQFTAYALGTMGPKALSAAPALRSERERFNGATRVHVAEALSKIDAFDQASVEVLMYGLQHPDTHVRWLSALSLGEVQPRYSPLVIPALVGGLKDADPEVRSAAALSIGGFGQAAESAVPELQSRATLDAPSVQEAAQTALACIRR